MKRYEDDVRADGASRSQPDPGRFLPAAAIVVAAFSFMLTTVVWRLVQQTSAVETAVHESIVGINRVAVSAADQSDRLRAEMQGQTAATAAIERRLGLVEARTAEGLARLQSLSGDMARQSASADQMRREMDRATAGITLARQEILERLAVHADRNATARDQMIREFQTALAQVERSLLAQADDLQQQKQQFDAAAERDRAARRAILQEATQAFSVQVDGLRQILDGLRIEADAAEGTVSSSSDAAAAVEVSEASDSDVPQQEQPGTPATAAADKDSVLE